MMKSLTQDDYSWFNDLPDEIIFQILNKLIDFKTLCFCKLVFKRFYSIVIQVDTISFTVLFTNPPSFEWNIDLRITGNRFSYGDTVYKQLKLLPSMLFELKKPIDLNPTDAFERNNYFRSAIKSLHKFTNLKSLSIEFPSDPDHREGVDHLSSFKWKANFGIRLDSFIFLWPDLVSEKGLLDNVRNVNGFIHGDESEQDDMELDGKKYIVAMKCLMDVVVWHRLLLGLIRSFPVLENVCIMDSGRNGRVSVSGEKVNEIRNSLSSSSFEIVEDMDVLDMVTQYFFGLLYLPVSGYVMKRVTLIMVEKYGKKNFTKSDFEVDDYCFNGEDDESIAYSEAVKEIFENLGSWIQ